MKFRRKQPTYDAEELDGGRWLVINLLTKERKVVTDREFRTQFEPIPEEKKPVQIDSKGRPKYPPLIVDLNEDTGEIKFREKRDNE